MTAELAGPGTTLSDMDIAAAEQLRRTRLARLRNGGDGAGRAAARQDVTPVGRPDRAEALARDTGGTVLQTRHRPIVVVESREPISASLDGPRDLPEPVDPSRPLVLFDVETTALGTGTGTLSFLVGIGTWHGTDFVTRLSREHEGLE